MAFWELAICLLMSSLVVTKRAAVGYYCHDPYMSHDGCSVITPLWIVIQCPLDHYGFV